MFASLMNEAKIAGKVYFAAGLLWKLFKESLDCVKKLDFHWGNENQLLRLYPVWICSNYVEATETFEQHLLNKF